MPDEIVLGSTDNSVCVSEGRSELVSTLVHRGLNFTTESEKNPSLFKNSAFIHIFHKVFYLNTFKLPNIGGLRIVQTKYSTPLR